jgi:hypothetical protein
MCFPNNTPKRSLHLLTVFVENSTREATCSPCRSASHSHTAMWAVRRNSMQYASMCYLQALYASPQAPLHYSTCWGAQGHWQMNQTHIIEPCIKYLHTSFVFCKSPTLIKDKAVCSGACNVQYNVITNVLRWRWICILHLHIGAKEEVTPETFTEYKSGPSAYRLEVLHNK